MGYRSDVRIATSRKGFNKLEKFVSNAVKQNSYNLLNDTKFKVLGKDVAYFGWNDIKWYSGISGYDSIEIINNGLEKLKADGYTYHFSRIGEDYDDFEEINYDGKRDDDVDVPYPTFERYFDDDDSIKYIEIEKENEVDIV